MMAKKEFKHLGKRGLAMFLTMVMTVSMLQLPAFAAGYQDQTMDNWYQLSEDNEIIGTTDQEIHEDLGFQLLDSLSEAGYFLLLFVFCLLYNLFPFFRSVITGFCFSCVLFATTGA